MDSTEIPKRFEKVWYSSIDYSGQIHVLKLAEDKGTLNVEEDSINFVGRKFNFKIIEVQKMRRDGEWIVVEGLNESGINVVICICKYSCRILLYRNFYNRRETTKLYKFLLEWAEIDPEEEEKDERLNLAKNYEKALRLEDAVAIYEEIEMWDDAGRVRKTIREMEKKDRETVTKHIHINANDLLDKIKREGLAIPYKCPNCSGTLKIDGKIKATTCPYCDTDLDLETLNDLVKALL